MIYEFRLYHVSHGRTAAEMDRMVKTSVLGAPAEPNGPPVHAQTLFERYGVAKPIAAWNATTGPGLPVFLYIQRWDSLDQRDAAFPKFWPDPVFQAIREAGEQGSPVVERVIDWLMRPSSVWAAVRDAAALAPVAKGLHELVIQQVNAGEEDNARATWAHTLLPRLKAEGADVVGVFELAVGAHLPAFILFLAWPDLDAQQRGWSAVEARPPEQPPFGHADHYLLEPLPWGVPQANFGEAA